MGLVENAPIPVARTPSREHLADWAPSASGLWGRLDLHKRDECSVELVVDYFVDLHYLVSHAFKCFGPLPA